MLYFVIIQLEVGIVRMGKEKKMSKEYIEREVAIDHFCVGGKI